MSKAPDEEIAGFGVRIREGGSRKFIYRYRIGGTQRRMSLGPATSGTVPEVRKTVEKLAHKVALGEDPALTKEMARRDAGHSFHSQLDLYLKARKSEKMKERSFEEIERHLTRHASPLHKLPVRSVTQLNVANLLNEIDSKRGPVAANRTRASLSAFFNWLMSEGIRLPEGNPVEHTRKRKEKSRERALSKEELRQIWNARNGDEYGAIVRLLMLTGQRRDEIAGLRWAEVKDEQIELPGERTKNGRGHIVPLSDAAKEILSGFTRKDRKFVFGRDDTGYSGYSRSKERLDKRIGENDNRTLHDLRRTLATGMAEDLKIAPHIIEAVLNHVSGHKAGVAGIYNRASYEKEKREALNLWAEHLMAIVEGRVAKVVPLKRGA